MNERTLAESFSSIWQQHLPKLDSKYIEHLNFFEVKAIHDRQVIASAPSKSALFSEIAFNLSALAHDNQELPAAIFQDKVRQQDLIAATAGSLSKLVAYTGDQLSLSDAELSEILGLAENTMEFIEKMGGRQVIFRPKVKGYGIISTLTADLSIDDTLFEIKTVNRNFKSSDLKQLFIYLALRHLSEEETFTHGGLYNPRKSTYCKFEVNDLIKELSDGNSTRNTFENLLEDFNKISKSQG